MATTDDIKRITRRSEALKALELGQAPVLDDKAFARFPEMQNAIKRFNEYTQLRDARLKNILAEALLAARDVPP